MSGKPFHVFEVIDRARLAGWYEHKAETSPVNLDHLYETARDVRNGPGEQRLGSYTDRAEAQADADRRTAANTLPGVTYVVEYLDVDEGWWTS